MDRRQRTKERFEGEFCDFGFWFWSVWLCWWV